MRGDLVLVNGHVITMDRTRPEASAVAIRNGTIAAVGDDAAARAAAGPGAEVIDLRGRTATPGLIDAHAHPMAVGFALADLDLATPPNRAIADLVDLVAAARSSGTDVELELHPPRDPLPPGLQLTVYRVVQEALTNARRHSPGSAVRVRVEAGRDVLCVEVTSTGGRGARSPRRGHGLGGLGGGVRQAGR